MQKFQRIYWRKDFDWKPYAKLYAAYCKSRENFYSLSAEALVGTLNLPKQARVLDVGAGTGALSAALFEKYPDTKIIALDLSKEMLKQYAARFANKASTVQGNAEEASKLLNGHFDAVVAGSSLWDMELQPFFASSLKLLRKGGVLAFNLPALVLGEKSGVMWFIIQNAKKIAQTNPYRKISREDIGETARKTGFDVEERRRYLFKLAQPSLKRFLDVLQYRYPFILYPDKTPQERERLTAELFKGLKQKVPKDGLTEEGEVFVLRKR